MSAVRVTDIGILEILAAHKEGDPSDRIMVIVNDRVLVAGVATRSVLVEGGVYYEVRSAGPSEAEQWLKKSGALK